MKNSNEITEYVLRKRNAYQEKLLVRNRRIKAAAAVCSLSLVLCISAVSFGYLSKSNSLLINEPDLIQETDCTSRIKDMPSEAQQSTENVQPASGDTAQTSAERVTDITEKPAIAADIPGDTAAAGYTSAKPEPEKPSGAGVIVTTVPEKPEHTEAKTTVRSAVTTVTGHLSAEVTELKTSKPSATVPAWEFIGTAEHYESPVIHTVTSCCETSVTSCYETSVSSVVVTTDVYDAVKHVSFTLKKCRYTLQDKIIEGDLIEEKVCNIMFDDFSAAEVYKIRTAEISEAVALYFGGQKRYYLYTAEQRNSIVPVHSERE